MVSKGETTKDGRRYCREVHHFHFGGVVVIERVGENDREKNNTKTLLKLIEFSCGYIGRYNKLINARRNP